jgi:hypothetical protein
MADDSTQAINTPDLSQALATPPQAPPTFSTGTLALSDPNFDYSGLKPEDIQKSLVSSLGELTQKLDPNSGQNQQLAQHLQSLTYTPEMRAQDMYNKLMGVKTEPGDIKQTLNFGNPIEGLPQFGLTQGEPTQKRNWLQSILGGAGEVARGLSEKKDYVPPMERFRDEANKQYAAEAGPAMRELLYETQDRHNAMTNITRQFGILNQSQEAAARQAVADEKVKTTNYLAQLKGQMQPEQYSLIGEKIANAKTLDELNQARTASEAAKTDYTKQQTTNITGGGSPEEREINRLMDSEGMTLKQAMDTYNKSKSLTKPPSWGQLVDENGSYQFWDKRFSPEQTMHTVPGMAGSIPANTPPGSTPQNDPVLQPEAMGGKLSPTDPLKKTATAYPIGNNIIKQIDAIPEDKMGDFKGAVYKYIDSNFQNADPRYKELLASMQSYGAFMTGVHSFRNKAFPDEMRELAVNPLTNKAAMKAAITGFQESAAQNLRGNRSLKNQMLNPASGYTYDDIKHIYHSNLEQTNTKSTPVITPQDAAAELQRRQGQK